MWLFKSSLLTKNLEFCGTFRIFPLAIYNLTFFIKGMISAVISL